MPLSRASAAAGVPGPAASDGASIGASRSALDRGDLRGDQLDPLEFPPDLGLEPLGQGTSVTGLERVETGQAILAERIVVDDPLPVRAAP